MRWFGFYNYRICKRSCIIKDGTNSIICREVTFVFNKARLCQIQRISNRYSYIKPELCYVALDSEYAQERLQIESWADELLPKDSTKRNSFASRLCDPEQFFDTYNELVVGIKLRHLGYHLVYEPQLPDTERRPDWCVYGRDDVPPFYLEVFTPNPSEDNARDEYNWKELAALIEDQTTGFGFSLQFYSDKSSPDPKQRKKVVTLVVRWLESGHLKIGDRLCFNDSSYDIIDSVYADLRIPLQITVVELLSESQKSWCTRPIKMKKVDEASLRRNIKAKVKKYSKSIQLERSPFVVCCIPHPISVLGHNSVETILYGDTVLQVFPNDLTRAINLGNGLLNGKDPIDPILTAVVWLSEGHTYSSWDGLPAFQPIGVYSNPNALFPLPSEALDFYGKLVNE